MSRKQTNLFSQVLARHWDDSEFEAYFGGWNAAFPATTYSRSQCSITFSISLIVNG
jgi:hypothetical protein